MESQAKAAAVKLSRRATPSVQSWLRATIVVVADTPPPPLVPVPTVPSSSASQPSAVASPPPPVINMPKSVSTLATGDEGSIGVSPLAPTSCIDGGRRDVVAIEQVTDVEELTSGEPTMGELSAKEPTSGEPTTGGGTNMGADFKGSA
ncbi:unnamed protein product [Closterium sp. NIES-53]